MSERDKNFQNFSTITHVTNFKFELEKYFLMSVSINKTEQNDKNKLELDYEFVNRILY